MLDINLIRQQPDLVRDGMVSRGDDPAVVDQILSLDERRRALLAEVEALKAERNRVSKEISRIKDAAEREPKIAEMRAVGDRIAALDDEVRKVEAERDAALLIVPNLPDPRTPRGKDDSENVVLRTEGEPRKFDFEPLPHWDLGTRLGLIDFERGVKLSGSRFYVLMGLGARLQRAVITFMLDVHRDQGYKEMYTPFVVRAEILQGAGQLPKFQDNLYHDVEDDKWLVPTAEVPLTGLHAGEILDAAQLPIWYEAYTPCFRREKVAAGKDVRGIKRGHQFDKVEMYKYCLPETSEEEHQKMLVDAEAVCARLGIAYRVKQLCTGDLGFGARITYDLEMWAPGQGEWLEVSSVSNCGDFQARRSNIRFRRDKGAKPEFVHTLNGSGLALPRTMIAIMENYQQADGGIMVPEVLRPYLGGLEVIR